MSKTELDFETDGHKIWKISDPDNSYSAPVEIALYDDKETQVYLKQEKHTARPWIGITRLQMDEIIKLYHNSNQTAEEK